MKTRPNHNGKTQSDLCYVSDGFYVVGCHVICPDKSKEQVREDFDKSKVFTTTSYIMTRDVSADGKTILGCFLQIWKYKVSGEKTKLPDSDVMKNPSKYVIKDQLVLESAFFATSISTGSSSNSKLQHNRKRKAESPPEERGNQAAFVLCNGTACKQAMKKVRRCEVVLSSCLLNKIDRAILSDADRLTRFMRQTNPDRAEKWQASHGTVRTQREKRFLCYYYLAKGVLGAVKQTPLPFCFILTALSLHPCDHSTCTSNRHPHDEYEEFQDKYGCCYKLHGIQGPKEKIQGLCGFMGDV